MELTGLILFIGSIIAMAAWILMNYKYIRHIDLYIKHNNLIRDEDKIGVWPAVLIFIGIAVSAGMAWG